MLRLALVVAAAVGAAAAPPAAWRSRTVYHLLTDRFALPPGAPETSCARLDRYCGGTLAGVAARLDYLEALGVDAIWISPVTDNTPNGYHGYWPRDLGAINANFGSREDLHALVDAAHARGMYVMLDIVLNHCGYGDIATFSPFSEERHYHADECSVSGESTQAEFEVCRLAGLPDLRHEDPFVRSTLLAFGQDLVAEFGFDGVRVDAVKHMPKDFLGEFDAAVGDTITVGEVFEFQKSAYLAGYQGPGVMDSVLNFRLKIVLDEVFAGRLSMTRLSANHRATQAHYADPSTLFNFVDNHDLSRFLSYGTAPAFRSALAAVFGFPGVPIVYYGSEQGLSGGEDPENREPLWEAGYDASTPVAVLVAALAGARRAHGYAEEPLVERLVTDDIYVFSRGHVLFALSTRTGPAAEVVVPSHPFSVGVEVCDLLDAGACQTVTDPTLALQVGAEPVIVHVLDDDVVWVHREDDPVGDARDSVDLSEVVVGYARARGVAVLEVAVADAAASVVSVYIDTDGAVDSGSRAAELGADLLVSRANAWEVHVGVVGGSAVSGVAGGSATVSGGVIHVEVPLAALPSEPRGEWAYTVVAGRSDGGAFSSIADVLVPPGAVEADVLAASPAVVPAVGAQIAVYERVVYHQADACGDEGVAYPTNFAFEPYTGLFDIESVTVLRTFDGGAAVVVDFAELTNPWGAVNGFSHQLIHVYVDVGAPGPGRTHVLSNADIEFETGFEWDLFVAASGWTQSAQGLAAGAPVVVYDEARFAVRIELPAQAMPADAAADDMWRFVVLAGGEEFGGFRPINAEAAEYAFGDALAGGDGSNVVDTILPAGYDARAVLRGGRPMPWIGANERALDRPTLTASRSGGELAVAVTGLTPDGSFVIVVGRRAEEGLVDRGPCEGVVLDAQVSFYRVRRADGSGGWSGAQSVPGTISVAQVLDLASCTVSEVASF